MDEANNHAWLASTEDSLQLDIQEGDFSQLSWAGENILKDFGHNENSLAFPFPPSNLEGASSLILSRGLSFGSDKFASEGQSQPFFNNVVCQEEAQAMSGEMIVAKGCEGDLPTAPEPGMGQAVTLSNPVINVTQEPFTTDPHKAKPRRRGDGSKKKVPVSTTSSKKVKHDVAQAADQFRTPVSAGRSSLSGGESSGSGGSEKKKKVYIRLTPADDFSSQETSKAGYNPKLELFIKLKRTIGSIYTHLMGKWNLVPSVHSLRLLLPGSCQPLADDVVISSMSSRFTSNRSSNTGVLTLHYYLPSPEAVLEPVPYDHEGDFHLHQNQTEIPSEDISVTGLMRNLHDCFDESSISNPPPPNSRSHHDRSRSQKKAEGNKQQHLKGRGGGEGSNNTLQPQLLAQTMEPLLDFGNHPVMPHPSMPPPQSVPGLHPCEVTPRLEERDEPLQGPDQVLPSQESSVGMDVEINSWDPCNDNSDSWLDAFTALPPLSDNSLKGNQELAPPVNFNMKIKKKRIAPILVSSVGAAKENMRLEDLMQKRMGGHTVEGFGRAS